MKKMTQALIGTLAMLLATCSFAVPFVIENTTSSTLTYLVKPTGSGFPDEGIPSTLGKTPVIVNIANNPVTMKVTDGQGGFCTVVFNPYNGGNISLTITGTGSSKLTCTGGDNILTIYNNNAF